MIVKDFLVENLFLFKNLKFEETEALFEDFDGYEEKFHAGQVMQSCRSEKRIGIIVKGKAIITSGNDGVIMRKLNKNDVFGAAALFDEPKHLTTVKAVSDCTVILLPYDFVLSCINKNNKVSLNYIEFLSKRISFLNTKINFCTGKSAESKLYSYLTQLPGTDNKVHLNVDMSTLAKMLGVGRATLYRAFDKLEESKSIIRYDKEIILKEV